MLRGSEEVEGREIEEARLTASKMSTRVSSTKKASKRSCTRTAPMKD
jgi:hypothetical protein